MRPLPLNREFYFFGIFFLGLAGIVSLFENIIRLQIKNQLLTLESYLPWLVFVTILILLNQVILLKYCHHKKYRTVFVFGIIYTIVLLCFSIILWSILTRKLERGVCYLILSNIALRLKNNQ